MAAEWALIRDGRHAPHQFTLLPQLDGVADHDPCRPRPCAGRVTRRWRGL
ncbi:MULTISPECIES: hypothetical protein [unclassified Streptomyces]|nr:MULTISPECIES: hypothetical protein [unclassified Streptomyces]MDF3141421.1 hypothetical protein [Streptomyces sp. T21Q-yed]WDF35316.1 hypothetical protein PBV52_00075 [Streptomyces sp. T12]WDF44472.1 hypothetical protein PBV52_50725 [Streptomyces sp. T12]